MHFMTYSLYKSSLRWYVIGLGDMKIVANPYRRSVSNTIQLMQLYRSVKNCIDSKPAVSDDVSS